MNDLPVVTENILLVPARSTQAATVAPLLVVGGDDTQSSLPITISDESSISAISVPDDADDNAVSLQYDDDDTMDNTGQSNAFKRFFASTDNLGEDQTDIEDDSRLDVTDQESISINENTTSQPPPTPPIDENFMEIQQLMENYVDTIPSTGLKMPPHATFKDPLSATGLLAIFEICEKLNTNLPLLFAAKDLPCIYEQHLNNLMLLQVINHSFELRVPLRMVDPQVGLEHVKIYTVFFGDLVQTLYKNCRTLMNLKINLIQDMIELPAKMEQNSTFIDPEMTLVQAGRKISNIYKDLTVTSLYVSLSKLALYDNKKYSRLKFQPNIDLTKRLKQPKTTGMNSLDVEDINIAFALKEIITLIKLYERGETQNVEEKIKLLFKNILNEFIAGAAESMMLFFASLSQGNRSADEWTSNERRQVTNSYWFLAVVVIVEKLEREKKLVTPYLQELRSALVLQVVHTTTYVLQSLNLQKTLPYDHLGFDMNYLICDGGKLGDALSYLYLAVSLGPFLLYSSKDKNMEPNNNI